jgi:glycosyltransferase involved in cell wall biosynthesis
MKIAIATITMSTRTGTEVATVDLARGLQRRGHDVFVFTSAVGGIADELLRTNIPVADNLRAAPFQPELIHGNHSAILLQAMMHFPRAAGVYVCHDATFFQNTPLDLTRIRAYVAVDRLNRERIERDVPRVKGTVELIHNAVDLDRFSKQRDLPAAPARALVLTKNRDHVSAVREACENLGISCDVLGPGVGRAVTDVIPALGNADIVFATARTAIEALAAGCAVVICDARGLAGMATAQNVSAWRDENFGAGILGQPATVDSVSAEIQRYDAHDAQVTSSYIRRHNDLERALDAYEAVYERALASNSPVVSDSEAFELSAVLREWLPQLNGDARVTSGTFERLRERISHLDAAVAELDRERLALEHTRAQQKQQLEAIHDRLHTCERELLFAHAILRSRSALARRLAAMFLFRKPR